MGKGPGSAMAVDSVRKHCEVVLKGNWDYHMTELEDHRKLIWHQEELGNERLSYLKELPVYSEFFMSGKLVRLCHASPHDVFHRVFLETDNDERIKLFAATPTFDREADVVGYGDIHGAHIDYLRNKTIFNAGSVGNPLEITQASYAVIEGEYGSEDEAVLSIAVIRVPYNIEEAVKHAASSDMPYIDEYIKELRTAVYRGKT